MTGVGRNMLKFVYLICQKGYYWRYLTARRALSTQCLLLRFLLLSMIDQWYLIVFNIIFLVLVLQVEAEYK